MNQKTMSSKTAIIVLAVVIAAALFIGFILVNKGDGPVMGMLLADRPMDDTNAYSAAAKEHGEGVYLVVSSTFNKLQEDYSVDIPKDQTLYNTIYLVECPKGSEFSGKWFMNGKIVGQEKGTLTTEAKGVITYTLGKDVVTSGQYTFELYDGDKKIFKRTFSVK